MHTLQQTKGAMRSLCDIGKGCGECARPALAATGYELAPATNPAPMLCACLCGRPSAPRSAYAEPGPRHRKRASRARAAQAAAAANAAPAPKAASTVGAGAPSVLDRVREAFDYFGPDAEVAQVAGYLAICWPGIGVTNAELRDALARAGLTQEKA